MSRFFSIFTVMILLVSGSAYAEEVGSRDEAVAMVKRVQSMFKEKGAEATFALVTKQDSKFKDRDLYPFIYDLKGVNVAHGAKPQLVGKNLLKLKDQGGKLLIKEMVDLAQGSKTGWVDYRWPNPVTNKIDEKSSYIEKLGDNYFVGVGIYKK